VLWTLADVTGSGVPVLRLLALAAVIWHNINININATNPRSLIAYDH
jgi:hypothetical protein